MKNRARAVWLLIFLGLILIPACGRGPGDALESTRRRGELRWGGDEEGGGPYIYRPENDVKKLTGFEIDLMAQVAGDLGVQSDFKFSNWAELLQTLSTGAIDVVVNGYELTPERLRDYIATIPYYAFELHLFVRSSETGIRDWADLKHSRPNGGKWRIGVLKNTVAADYVAKTFAGTVESLPYDGTTDAFRTVQSEVIDGTVTDTPAALFYGPQFKVKQAGRSIERGWYVMYLRPQDAALRDAINDSLRRSFRDGRYKSILDKYGLWNASQNELTKPEVEQLSESMRPLDAASGPWHVVAANLPLLLEAAWMTVKLSVVAMPIAIILGLLIALGRLYGPAVVRWPLAIYVELVRGTPLLLQLYFIYFGIVPMLNLPESLRASASVFSAICGLALNYAAYESEIYRAGLLAIPAGQTEAALALGLSRWQALRFVVIPQAVRLVVPPVTNDFINLFKDTSICSVIAVEELSKRYNISSNNSPRAFVELAIVTAVLYLLMSYPLSLLSRRLENRPQGKVR